MRFTKYTITIIILLIIPFFTPSPGIFAESEGSTPDQDKTGTEKKTEQVQQSSWTSLFGITFIPYYSWQTAKSDDSYIGFKDLDMSYDPTTFTSIQASFWSNSTGLSFGFNAGADYGNMEDAAAIAGFLGLKNILFQASHSRIKGVATWKGGPVDGQPESMTFDNNYDELAILYFFKRQDKSPDQRGIYMGIGYRSFTLPLEIRNCSQPVYVDAQEIKNYTLLWGYDSMINNAMNIQKKGLDGWIDFQMALGAGFTDLNDEAVRRIKEANPTYTSIETNLICAVFDMSFNFGISYLWKMGPVTADIGAGFNAGLQTFSASGNSDNDDYTRFKPEMKGAVWHYGPMVKAIVAW